MPPALVALSSAPAAPVSAAPACSAAFGRLVVEVDGLSKTYADRRVLDDVSFRITSGEIVGLLGVNGAGKSTMIEILCGLRLPTRGQVRVCGAGPTEARRHGGLAIAAVLQETALDPVMSPRESLELQGRVQGLGAAASRRRATRLLDRLDLAAHADDRIGTLSGGWRRRVDLAVALVHTPALLVLDEPTTGLDPLARHDFWRHLRAVNQEDGTAILLCTQDLAEADALADRLLLLRSGKLIAVATPAELKAMVGSRTLLIEVASGDLPAATAALAGKQTVVDPEHEGRFLVPLGEDDTAITRLVSGLAAAGVPIRRLTVCEPTLDDVFVQVASPEVSRPERSPSA